MFLCFHDAYLCHIYLEIFNVAIRIKGINKNTIWIIFRPTYTLMNHVVCLLLLAHSVSMCVHEQLTKHACLAQPPALASPQIGQSSSIIFGEFPHA